MSFNAWTYSSLQDQREEKWHLPFAPEISEVTARTAELVYDYNHLRPSATKEKQALLSKILAPGSGSCIIKQPMTIEYGVNTYIGEGVFINYGVTILDTAAVHISNRAMIGPNCQFITVTHPVDDTEMRDGGWEIAHPIHIGVGVWLGAGVTVLPGVSIGDYAVIGAGSVVTKDIPAHTIAVGNPARVVRSPQEDRFERSQLPPEVPVHALSQAMSNDPAH
ncbi:maltose O-acetyltransferase [Corynebacterium kutscheri]|uniref:Acetyltransferase (Isoleucine patch superfamily) n=1 Tax=Corynebacterium kutscheri TaxID=35755 RepID=A0A0F6TCF8_9CORY|nr:sugar O-acetyltransferase [Corynebacterium kutscheri]AKE40301.1 acetyltransferase (isoleucine patch superfamily) [Corynebacterium kutscheri]VEH05484.1 maltose O-acetyltransferase [Corynebacterium kutscheri]VEH10693.1 maltose O-acetyltransferase [Corynebacterium kutscheri]VEH81375.1 maltose O-acetyltransferase [Corynebacterium kutscheri]